MNIQHSADGNIELHSSTDGGSNYVASTLNDFVVMQHSDAAAATTAVSAGTSEITMSSTQGGTGTLECLNGHVRLYSPHNTVYDKYYTWQLGFANTADVLIANTGAGRVFVNQDIDAVKFAPSTGTFTGKINAYGWVT